MEVFKDGGPIKEYWRRKKFREENPIMREPTKVIEMLSKALVEINELSPTCDEIVAFSKGSHDCTSAKTDYYFGPRLHNTWGSKRGGRVHIDIGCAGVHLMLTKMNVNAFIDFIKDNREL